MGIVPVMPKRKEHSNLEIGLETDEDKVEIKNFTKPDDLMIR
jgi:hypothetical protein